MDEQGSESSVNQSLVSFIEEVQGDMHLRVDEDLGSGYVRLRASEAEKRQAAQDIRSSEDILIEMLRNSRDAGARNIFIALQRSSQVRTIVVIDDGDGIPSELHRLVFEPRVTSKLDTAHMDKWGMHGRGMALYSISVNAEVAEVVTSEVGKGSAIRILSTLDRLGEKTDQSAFPYFEETKGILAMRGPKNLLRTAAEFALEHRGEVSVYIGSFTDMAATMYGFGCATIPAAQRVYARSIDEASLVKRLAFAADPDSFTDIAASLGLEISPRSARRILDGKIHAEPSLIERIEDESFAKIVKRAKDDPKGRKRRNVARVPRGDEDSAMTIPVDEQDIALLEDAMGNAFSQIAEKYYLESQVEPTISVKKGSLVIEIPLVSAH